MATLAGRAVVLAGVGGDLSTARFVASQAASAGAFGVMVHEPAGPFRTREGWLRYHVDLARPCPIWRSCHTSATRRSGRTTFGRSSGRRRTSSRSSTPCRTRCGSRRSSRRPKAAVDLWPRRAWAPFFWPAGATAFTSGLALVEPRLSLALLEQLRGQRASEARATWTLIQPFEALRARNGGAANIPAVKEALALRSVIGRTVRPPISELGSEDRRRSAGSSRPGISAQGQPGHEDRPPAASTRSRSSARRASRTST